MAHCYTPLLPKFSFIHFVPSFQLKSSASRNFKPRSFSFGKILSSVVVASAGPSHCDFSSLNTPHQPCSPVGKFLAGVLLNRPPLFHVAVAGVLLNRPPLFHVAVAGELKLLAQDRDATVSRLLLSSADEACLHRRIAEMKQSECQVAIGDVMYVLILSKFSDIGVPLVPELSKCIYNGRLELWPSKDWELHSIHSAHALDMVKEHVSTVIGLRLNSSVTDTWQTTNVPKTRLARCYAASVLYGYFLKTASSRLRMEQSLGEQVENGKLRRYVLAFGPEALERCAKVKSREAANLIEAHCSALFGDEDGKGETVVTSFSSLKRLALEGVAFGSFLWEAEEYVGTMCTLGEN